MHYSDLHEDIKNPRKLWSLFENTLPILKKEFDLRSDDENNKVLSLFEEISHLRNHIHKQNDRFQAFTELSKAFQYEVYSEHQALHHYGTIPQRFSLIIKGEIRRFVPKSPAEIENELNSLNFMSNQRDTEYLTKAKSAKENDKTALDREIFREFNMDKKYFTNDVLTVKQQKIFNPGNYIGDLPIVFNSPFDDTMVTWTEVHVLSIEKKEYKRIFEMFIRETQEKIAFLEEILPKKHQEALAMLGYIANKRVLNIHDKVFQQGMNSDSIYFIRQGDVELWGTVKTSDLVRQGDRSSCKVNKFDKILKENRNNVKVSVVLLSRGQLFGEESILGIDQRMFSAIVKSLNTILYEIPKVLLIKLLQNYPEFKHYLVSQAQVAFDGKMVRYSNLEQGVEKFDSAISTSPSKTKNKVLIVNESSLDFEDGALNKEIMNQYVANVVHEKERDGSQNPHGGIRSKELENKAVLSPKATNIYRKMAELKTSMVYDKVKLDTKLIAEARKDESKQREDKTEFYKNYEVNTENEKKYYFSETLWLYAKKTHKEKPRRVNKSKVEEELLEKILEDAKLELKNKQSDSDFDCNFIVSKKPKKLQEKESPMSKIKQNTSNIDGSGKSEALQDDCKIKGNSLELSPNTNENKGSRLSKFYNQVYGLENIKKRNMDTSSKNHLEQTFYTTKMEENKTSMQIVKMGSNNQCPSMHDKIYTEVTEASSLSSKLPANTQKTVQNIKLEDIKKMQRIRSLSPRKLIDVEKSSDPLTKHRKLNNRKESSNSVSIKEWKDSSYRTTLNDILEDDVQENLRLEKTIKLPTVANKKLESPKQSILGLIPKNDRFTRSNYKVFV